MLRETLMSHLPDSNGAYDPEAPEHVIGVTSKSNWLAVAGGVPSYFFNLVFKYHHPDEGPADLDVPRSLVDVNSRHWKANLLSNSHVYSYSARGESGNTVSFTP